MASLADEIQAFIAQRLAQGEGPLTLRRVELAQRFGCAPSQITYVIETRFSLERGYRVESRRGGGGYVRIEALAIGNCERLLARIGQLVGDEISEDGARGVIHWLRREELLDRRGAALMTAAVRRDVLALPLPLRDHLRARVLLAMVRAALGSATASGEAAQAAREAARPQEVARVQRAEPDTL